MPVVYLQGGGSHADRTLHQNAARSVPVQPLSALHLNHLVHYLHIIQMMWPQFRCVSDR